MVLAPSTDDVQQSQQQQLTTLETPRLSPDQQTRFEAQHARYLSQNQKHLLLAALNSQAASGIDTATTLDDTLQTRAASGPPGKMNGISGDGLFMSPQQAQLDNFNGDFTPDLDYLDGDSFDFDNADIGGEMIGALPGATIEQHEKRKISDGDIDDEEGDAKRQETQEGEKSAKKPGRKPLTSEPTTVSSKSYLCDAAFVLTQSARNAKRKTELPNAHSASARRHTSKILKPR